MVSRRATGRADGYGGTGEENSSTTPDADNPVLQQILRRMDQLQEHNQTLQQRNQTLQTQVITLVKSRGEEEDPDNGPGEFHPFSMEIAETPFPTNFREPPLKDYDGTTDPQEHKRKNGGERSRRREEGGSSSKRRREDEHRGTKDKEEVRGVVTTIAGGFNRGGKISSAKKRYARQVMVIQTGLFEQGNNHPVVSFTHEDFREIQPH
ncbi:hypothetical protein SESBI_44337 [Sesbania bispinosa]|nr:hypothetical protein SESBI_44337 [Sesbania bispinosa]